MQGWRQYQPMLPAKWRRTRPPCEARPQVPRVHVETKKKEEAMCEREKTDDKIAQLVNAGAQREEENKEENRNS